MGIGKFNIGNAIDKEIDNFVKGRKKLAKAWVLLKKDRYILGLLEQSNKVAIVRMGYNDHGPVHAKIVALHALKMMDLLKKEPSVVAENVGDYEDSQVAVLLGAYLHDCGICLVREQHELTGTIVSRNSINSILTKIYSDQEKVARMASFVSESVLCHMGTHQATSLEARVVESADGTDASKGRARIPFHIGKQDIHKFSALAIERIDILPGRKKPIRIEVYMDNPAGIFQTEQIMLKKIEDAKMTDYIEIIANIKGSRPTEIL